MKKSLFICSLILIALVSISYADKLKMPAAEKPGHEAQTDEASSNIEGKVMETMNGGGYTYVNIEKGGKKTWVAVPEMEVKKGQQVSFLPGAIMTDFSSKTLNRTFETIIFSAGPAGSGGGTHGAKAEAPAVKKVKVDKASGSDAYTVAELHKKSAELNGKTVVIRAQVVKVTAEIMDKNWVHIQDGSGKSSDGTDDMTVTTKDLPELGNVVTVKGKLSKDKDFGYGYKYGVIVEDATIKK